MRLAFWGSDDDLDRYRAEQGPGRDETAEALAAFGLREVRDE